MSTPTARPRTKTPAQLNNERYDLLVRGEANKGWKMLNVEGNQEEAARLLTAAAKRVGMNIKTSIWDNGKTVTFKATRKK